MNLQCVQMPDAGGASVHMDNLSGRNIKGYQLLERIGAGGFGAVYKANQSTIGREVAMKIILPHFANHPDFIRRFETEAQLIARLEHLHIVHLFDYWRDPDGAYLVMRWLRGGSLREALNEKRFEVEAAALLIDQIAAALAVAHQNNVIHRDLKPCNILLDEDGNAYLADFGIAKDVGSPGITEVDALVGSPDYLAPEQANGEAVTPRTDIYSLAVVLYEMLTGQHPFPNLNPVERLYKHLSEPLPEITSLPDDICHGVNTVIQKATAKNPAHRYPDAMALAAAFREAIKLHHTQSLVETLTQREQEILSRIIAGMSNQQIAEELVITVGTVKWYVNQIFRKLNVRSRVQAIVKARELNLIVPGNGTALFASVIPTEDFQPENPYKGLLAFQAADNQDFFGREKLVQKLVSRLTEPGDYARFLAVVGPSGSGKSCLVKAGLIPALWRGDVKGSEKWFVAEMLPGSHPLDELEVALMRVAAKPHINLREQLGRNERGLLRASQLILPEDGSEIVLVIDQFEEVFTLVEDELARQHFLSLLHSAGSNPRSRMRVVITLRADFYDRPLHYPDFGELMRTRTETLLPLGTEGLERAISKPAERVGAVFELGLVAEIVGDVHYQPGALPLLQYALTELFEQRRGRILTRKAYQSIGGTIGALAKRAEDTYDELPPEAQHITHQMFLRLVTLGEGTEDTRRRTQRSELLALTPDADVMDEVIDTFAAYRLLSLDNDPITRSPTVEVAHEAILREWERLRVWINDSREEIKMQQQLAHITEEWLIASKDVSYLASGLRLEQFEKWTKETTQALTPDERAYLEASLNERTHHTDLEAERHQREQRLERRSQTFLRGLVAVLLLATLGAFGLTGFAVNQANVAQTERDTAQFERERAEQQSRIAQSRELVGYATNTLETDAELSTLLALQAVNTTYALDGSVLPEAETMLHQAVQRLNPPLRLPAAPYGWGIYGGVSMTRDGMRLAYMAESAYEGRAGETSIADVATGDVLYTISGETMAFNSFIDHVTTWLEAENDTVIFQHWDITSEQSPQMIASFTPELSRSELDRIDWIDFSSDFRYAAILLNTVNRVFDLSTGEEITELVNLPPGKGFTQFSPDSPLMAHLNPDDTLSILETATWMETARIESPGTRATYFKFSPFGAALIVANANNTVSIWETDGFTELYTVSTNMPTQRLALSSDGNLLAIASVSGGVIIWNTVAQEEQLRLSIGGNVAEITFDAEGTRLISYHTSGQVKITNLVAGQEYLTMVNDPILDNGPSGLAYSPDGEHLVVGSMSATPTVWNARTGQRIFNLSGHSSRVLSVTDVVGEST